MGKGKSLGSVKANLRMGRLEKSPYIFLLILGYRFPSVSKNLLSQRAGVKAHVK